MALAAASTARFSPTAEPGAHQGQGAPFGHDRPQVGEVGVDVTGHGDQVGDTLGAVVKHIVGLLEHLQGQGVLGGDLQKLVIGDGQQGVDALAQLGHAGLGHGQAAPALEHERFGDHGHGQGVDLLGQFGHQGGRPGAGSAAQAAGDEDHVRPFQDVGDGLPGLLGRPTTDLRIAAGPQAPGVVGPQLNPATGLGRFQGLQVRVGGDELHSGQAGLDHVVDGVAAGSADADHFDFGSVINFHDFHSHVFSPL